VQTIHIHSESGWLSGAVNVPAAITERRHTEERLREADRSTREFLATLAHELRNPLAPLRNALQIMRLARYDPAATEQVHGMMERQLEQLVRLIDDLLDLSRIADGKIELQRERIEPDSAIQHAIENTRPSI